VSPGKGGESKEDIREKRKEEEKAAGMEVEEAKCRDKDGEGFFDSDTSGAAA